MQKYGFLLVLLVLLQSCDLFKKKDPLNRYDSDMQPVARVQDKFLYKKDIEDLFNDDQQGDSAQVAAYVDKWVKEQLLLNRAGSVVESKMEKIEELVNAYRNDLILHEYKKAFVRSKGDSLVSDEDILKFYEENSEKFQLNQNIFKGVFVKVPSNVSNLSNIKKLVHSDSEEGVKDLRSFCLSYASFYHLDDSLWVNFDELVAQTPLASMSNKGNTLDKKKYVEMSDSKYTYILRVVDFKTSSELSPLEFVRDQIKNTLLNKKRLQLVNELEDNLYQEAGEEKEYEIYLWN
ncbi:hypothetical protein RCC89_05895 [Cytophagaceae bacterium ABcell3]|nr:hypothetical protein RCC89_05895 [Cytophagaceae bacterium ABcell3]